MRDRIDRLVHDARGPLNTIVVNAELAQLLQRSGGNPERLQKALAAIVNESQRCNRILQDFRDELQRETPP
ncbi:MAG TPA: histidine kinase dimerization/phospho-acceptor domain-containing protein [Hyphomicrobiales bacterium]|nr:histidine kinase dimerization/phospho-acceptor domain-containing protein [Hyphomicrobiales bacterium]